MCEKDKKNSVHFLIDLKVFIFQKINLEKYIVK